MKKVTSDIAKSLKKLRSQRKLTQGQVAEAVGIEPTSYAYYEYGKRSPRPEILQRLAGFFNVDVADLYRADDAPQFTLSERAPMGELIKILQKKASSIPDDVVDLAMNFSATDGIWDEVRGALEHELKKRGSKRTAKKKA